MNRIGRPDARRRAHSIARSSASTLTTWAPRSASSSAVSPIPPYRSQATLPRTSPSCSTAQRRARVAISGFTCSNAVAGKPVAGPATTRARIRLIALLGASPRVEFEFHVADWLRSSSKGLLVKPEVDKLTSERILCLAGEDDHDSLCPQLHAANIDVVILKGSHHFDGNYERLGRIVLEHIK